MDVAIDQRRRITQDSCISSCSGDLAWRNPSQWRCGKPGCAEFTGEHLNSDSPAVYRSLLRDVMRHSTLQIEDSWSESNQKGLVDSKKQVFKRAQCDDNGVSASQAATFISSLRDCTWNSDLRRGNRIHHELVRRGLLEDCLDELVTMYAKCGELQRAQALFDMHKSKDVITWTALIAGYTRTGQGGNALNCLEQMKCEGLSPNSVTYLCALKACAATRAIIKGKQIHDEIARQGLLKDSVVLGNALVDMYAKCKSLSEARQVLLKLPSRNVVSWNTLIAGYTKVGEAEQALNCFKEMWCEGILPNAGTYASALKACAAIKAIDMGKQIHDEISRQGLLQNDIVLGGALVDMYAKCGALSDARLLLEELPSCNIVCWNALIAGYVQAGEAEQALKCLQQMQNAGFLPDTVTYVSILKACTALRAANKGRKIHEEIAKQGLLLQKNSVVLGNALVDMYANCGAFSEAQQVLEQLSFSDVVSWNALIGGYVQVGEALQALNCFEQMQFKGMMPNEVTFATALKACAAIRALERGKEIHSEIGRRGLLLDNIILGGSVVDMYVKCGDVSEAQKALEQLPSRDLVTWNAMISGYAQVGEAEQALSCLSQMQFEGILPNEVTCASVLNVCCHLGLMHEAERVFADMSLKYGVEPSIECYTCMIDLYGRAGHLEKAVRIIQQMPSSDHTVTWHALLGACQQLADVNVGKWAFERAVTLDRNDDIAYVLIGDIYAAAGMSEEVKRIEAIRRRNKLLENPEDGLFTDVKLLVAEISPLD